MHVRLQLAAEVAAFALSTPLAWEKVEPQPNGSVIVETSLPDIYWAASMALSYGPGATVLEPEELRQLVREWGQSIVELYK